MFDLVADVEQYPRFVPFCRALKVRRRERGEGGTEVLIADMTVAYKLIKETFTSRVALNRSQLSIDVKYLNGPFSRMENRWAFHPISDNACEVEFFLFYEFKSRAFALLMGAMFDAVFRRFASAFERRADALYGTV
jgi:coenzyme Q-binding protein COQ10